MSPKVINLGINLSVRELGSHKGIKDISFLPSLSIMPLPPRKIYFSLKIVVYLW